MDALEKMFDEIWAANEQYLAHKKTEVILDERYSLIWYIKKKGVLGKDLLYIGLQDKNNKFASKYWGRSYKPGTKITPSSFKRLKEVVMSFCKTLQE